MSLPSFYQTKKEPEKDPVKVYFAGKMNEWRADLSDDGDCFFDTAYHGKVLLSCEDDRRVVLHDLSIDHLPIKETRWAGIHCVGPYSFRFDLLQERDEGGPAHGVTAFYSGKHASRKAGYVDYHFMPDWERDPEGALDHLESYGVIAFEHGVGALGIDEVWKLNMDAINRCNLFVAYFSDETCFGTLAEIGYAYGIGKRVVIFKDSKVSADFSIFAEQFSRQDAIWELNEGKRFDEVFEEFLIENGFIQPAALEHVYVMRLGDTQHYKIGRTTRDPTEREKELNGTKAPYDVNLVCQIKTNDCAKLEAFFHEKYKETRGRGEWFNLTPHQIFELIGAAKISDKEAIDCSKLPLNLLGTLRLESN